MILQCGKIIRIADMGDAGQPNGRAVTAGRGESSDGDLEFDQIGIGSGDAHIRLGRWGERFRRAGFSSEGRRASRQQADYCKKEKPGAHIQRRWSGWFEM